MVGVPGAPASEQDESLTQSRLRERFPSAWDEESRRFVFGDVDFAGAVFRGAVNFDDAEFEGSVTFQGATFEGPVSFQFAHFRKDARFDSVTFEGTASFRGAHFHGTAIFEHDDKEEMVPEWPEEVTFKRWANFRRAEFHDVARFGGARFEGRARWHGAHFMSHATFEGARFTRSRTMGWIDVVGDLVLDRVVFEAPVRIRVNKARRLSCRGTQFQSLTSIDLLEGEITLEEAAFAEPSSITGRVAEPKPRVRSLRGANVAHVTLADLDLRRCSFLGVHNLDGLRFEGAIDLFAAGAWWTTKRMGIADEVRVRRGAGAGVDERDMAEPDKRVMAERIARAYRALRKGREDSKDAPGAADFYYGEMQMRRKAARGFDRLILFAYWLTSGYGLRAWRSLAALAVTVVLFAWGFQAWGFDPDQGFWESLLFSAESTTSLFRAPSPPNGAELGDAGRVLQMGLRLLGPLFFGLALLALRGRVKR